jgi:broad specificity phosphatase PhoE
MDRLTRFALLYEILVPETARVTSATRLRRLSERGKDAFLNQTWLIRHGESAANAGAVTADPASIALTEKGWAQAQAVSAAFETAPDLIVVSPFLRTRQTAQATMARFPDVPVEQWAIQEFTYLAPASCAHSSVAQRKPRVAAYWERCDPDYVDGPGAESFSALLERAARMLEKLQSPSAGFTAVFAHGQIIQAALMLLDAQSDDPRALMRCFRAAELASPIGNGGIVKLGCRNNVLCLLN